MIDRNESLRDQIATIVQAGYSERKTSVETADEIRSKISLLSIVTALELKLAEAEKDTARLELLKHDMKISHEEGSLGHADCWCVYTNNWAEPIGKGATLREAIDAMEAAK